MTSQESGAKIDNVEVAQVNKSEGARGIQHVKQIQTVMCRSGNLQQSNNVEVQVTWIYHRYPDWKQVKLVGCIVEMENASTNTEYTIEDTTGRLKVTVAHFSLLA